MKMTRRLHLWLFPLISLLLLFTGCYNNAFIATTPANNVITIEPTLTSQPNPSTTISPTLTLIPTPTRGSTQLPTNTPTITQVVLSPDEIQARLREYLVNNGNCTTPCFFGIEPGKTTLDQVVQQFSPVLGKSGIEQDPYGTGLIYSKGFSVGNYITGEIILGFKNNIVDWIDSSIHNLDKEAVQPSEWTGFSIRKILQMFGVPSKIVFYIDYPHEPTTNPGIVYSYLMFFDEYKVVIYHLGGWMPYNRTYHICLAQEKPNYIRFWFNTDRSGPFTEGVELSQATKLSNQDFYNMYIQEKTENSCIDLTASKFNQ